MGIGATEKTSRAVSRNALSAVDFHRSSCQTIWVRTSKGSPYCSAASLPFPSSTFTATLGKMETPMPAATHYFMASILWNSIFSGGTTPAAPSWRSNWTR